MSWHQNAKKSSRWNTRARAVPLSVRQAHFVGKLIQDAGLRGFTVGGAQVSEKHCGFVINRDHATSWPIFFPCADRYRIR